ncbi:hypothetical protein BU17DRAFT_64769 [Hysterangium stoloniferum]|nr:hypothetical protein BU17DRAFT_64769 [Hysterangium stoloniferum]
MSASSRLNDSEFIEKQRSYFSGILCRRWACDEPEHDVCVLTVDGGHFQLTEEQINLWVDVLCSAEGSALQPPDGLLPSGGQSSTSTPPAKAVSITPSRRHRARSRILAATASIRESLDRSTASTSTITPGYYGNKGLEWIGRNTLNAIEKSLLYTKFWQYQSTFEKDHTGDYTARLQLQYRWLGKKHTMPLSFIKSERKLSRMLQNTLEMTQDYYSTAVQRRALDTLNSAWRVDSWQSAPYRLTTELCKSYVSALTNNSPEQVRDNLFDALMKAPLEIHGDQAACAFISVLCRHVIYSPEKPGYTDSKEATHFHILCMTVKRLLATRQLSSDEISMLWDLAKRRVERYTAKLNPDRIRILYEVELFSLCAGQDSRFQDLFLSPPGIPRIVENAHMKVAEREATSTEIWFKLTWDILGAVGALLDHRYGFQPYVDYCREEMSELLSRIATPSVDRPMAAQGEPQD